MNLDQAVHELTRPHKTTITRDNGAREYVTEDSLLNQLREAIHSSSSHGGNASNRRSLPLSADALDLFQEISHTAQDLKASRPGIVKGSVESIIQAWSQSLVYDLDKNQAERIVTKWVTRIRNLLNPPRRAEIKEPCPHCGTRQIINDEGDINLALTMTNGTVTCGACLTEWTGQQLWHLKDAIDYNQTA